LHAASQMRDTRSGEAKIRAVLQSARLSPHFRHSAPKARHGSNTGYGSGVH
jgi:hypothetical protein